MGEFDAVLTAADKAGVIAMAFAFILSLHKGWLVLGKPHDQCMTEKASLRALLDTKAQKVEADLDRIRAEREEMRHGSP